MHRSAKRLLTSAAVIPVMFVAGCSSDSDEAADAKPSASKPAESSPSLAAAKYGKLPKPCDALAEKTVEDLVPEAEDKGGTNSESSDVNSRGSCSWYGLDDDYQYRWLDVSFQRFESEQVLGSAEERAKEYYTKQVNTAKTVKDAKKVVAATASGIGDEAGTVRYDITKDDEGFKNQTVVTRTENVVITVVYNGTAYEDAKDPKAEDLLKDAVKAAKEAVRAVADANKAGADAGEKAKGEDKDAAKGEDKAASDA